MSEPLPSDRPEEQQPSLAIPSPAPLSQFGRLAAPLGEIVAHFLISSFNLIAIKLTEVLMGFLGYGEKLIPFTTVPLDNWVLFLEVASFSCINALGIWKAVQVYARQ